MNTHEPTLPTDGLEAVDRDTSVLDRALPEPGSQFRDRKVRASGTLPENGSDFVLFRHTAREQLGAVTAARAQAKKMGQDSSEFVAAEAGAILISMVAEFRSADQSDWRKMLADDILDLDADDFEALNRAGAEGQSAPVPPSPSS